MRGSEAEQEQEHVLWWSEAQVDRILAAGFACRATGVTAMNEQSSRSHMLVCVEVTGTDVVTGAATRSMHSKRDRGGMARR